MTQSYPMSLEPEKALEWPIDRVALHLLKRMGPGKQNRHSFLNSAVQNYQNNGLRNAREITNALAEAYDWLILHGLLSGIPQEGDWLFITRKGQAVRDDPNGRALIRAEARIDLDLHPRIAGRIRSQFLLGEYDTAAFIAMREVEVRLLELVGAVDDSKENLGVRLVTRVFKTGGPLCDPTAEPGEQVAIMNLFQGAIGGFKNPPSHRNIEYANVTFASEVVIFADLLHRLLDERAETLGLAE